MSFSANEGTRSSTLEQKLISGYDGFGGVHDNILWNVTAGFTYFTLNNKLIMENTKTRKQHIFHEPLVQLSCMAGSVNEKYIAVGEGSTNPNGNSVIYLYNIENKKLMSRFTAH